MPGIIGTKEMLERVRDLKEQTVMNGFNKTEDVDKFFSENWMHLLDILDDALSEYLVDDEPQTDCLTCRYNSDEWDSPKCDGCSKAHNNYEPQADCAWK